MIGILPVLLAVSGFVSGSETALFSLSDAQRLAMKRSGSVGGTMAVRLLDDTRDLLITLMFSNMVVNVMYFVITTVLLIRLTESGQTATWLITAAVIAVPIVLILTGEVLPKMVASHSRVVWSRRASAPLMVIHRGMSPVRVVLRAAVITPLARLIAPREKPPQLSPRELESLLQLSARRGVIDASEEQLLQQVLELGQLRVRNLMTPRVDIRAFDLNGDPAELLDLLRETRLSRIPVYRGDLDHIEGIVYARQLLLRRPKDAEQLKSLVRQVNFVPEQQRADHLLVDMRKTGTTLAVVVDEYGGTAGLITLEDIVEHMVGDIAGAYETRGEAQITQIGPNQWRVDADLSVEDWSDLFDARGGHAAVTTLGGLVMARLGRVPQEHDRVEISGITIDVERMEGKRIGTLLLQVTGDAT